MKVLVTGGTNGMGKGVAKILAQMDNQSHEIIILCRSEELGEATIKEFVRDTGNRKISTVLCDLARLSDVRHAIEEIQRKHEYLDGIFINAGLGYAQKRVETEDGMDSHFQVNYLSQFMLSINLLNLLESSVNGGRIVFNVTEGGEIFWDDLQMNNDWSYEKGIGQAMTAKRMFCRMLHTLYRSVDGSKVSFTGFQIPKTVWSNQVNIIPAPMKTAATLMKFFGKFITIEKCGEIMAPLFTENQEESLKKSGHFITWKNNEFIDLSEGGDVLDQEMQDRLWAVSLDLCSDDKTTQIAESLMLRKNPL